MIEQDAAVCCGEPGAWAPKGKPLVVGCRLCPRSPSYWRLPDNRADGRPYKLVGPLDWPEG